MPAYRLCLNGDGWTIVDEATLAPARLDSTVFEGMAVDEAKHMFAILKGIDRIRSASRSAGSSANRIRRKTHIASAFGSLRSLTAFSGPSRGEADETRH